MLRTLRSKIGEFVYYKILSALFFKNSGMYVLEERWDNLIILDACRYDIFERVYRKGGMGGRLEYRFSRGTNTATFLIENFGYGKFEDIVYITANPMVNRFLEGRFYKIIPVWKAYWDDRSNTVPPSAVYYSVLEVLEKYPNKRLIIHFLQPHPPYPNGIGYHKVVNGEVKCKIDKDCEINWRNFRIRPIKVDKLLEGYIENLKLALPYVKKLINILPGRTVVTADHGEAFGEIIHPLIPVRVYSHPRGIRIPALTKVPWLVVEMKKDNDEKRTIVEKERVRLKIKEFKKMGKYEKYELQVSP